MFEFSEIQPGDLIRVLLNFDDVDDDAYALVEEHCEDPELFVALSPLGAVPFLPVARQALSSLAERDDQ